MPRRLAFRAGSIAAFAAIASDQSEPVASRDILDERMAALEQEYPDGTPIPRPDKWGGFRILPERFEFWFGCRSDSGAAVLDRLLR